MRYVGIDPSTKTGFVALDKQGNTLRAKELTGVGNADPKRMITLIDEIVSHIQKDDFIVIEGFGYASQQAIQNGGLGWGIRMALARRGIKYTEVAPNALKKFVGVTGWTTEDDKKRRLTAKEKKPAVMNAVNEHFGFTSSSDNVVDAYVLARVCRALNSPHAIQLRDYQFEVLQAIKNPPAKKKKVKK